MVVEAEKSMIRRLQGDPGAPHVVLVKFLRPRQPTCVFQSGAEVLRTRSTEGGCPSSNGQAERGKEQMNPPLTPIFAVGTWLLLVGVRRVALTHPQASLCSWVQLYSTCVYSGAWAKGVALPKMVMERRGQLETPL